MSSFFDREEMDDCFNMYMDMELMEEEEERDDSDRNDLEVEDDFFDDDELGFYESQFEEKGDFLKAYEEGEFSFHILPMEDFNKKADSYEVSLNEKISDYMAYVADLKRQGKLTEKEAEELRSRFVDPLQEFNELLAFVKDEFILQYYGLMNILEEKGIIKPDS